jgi:hypothetical protein
MANRHLLIADSAEDFAEACSRALTDSALRNSLVSAAVEVAAAHAWPRAASTVSEIAMAECAPHRPVSKLSTGSDGGSLPARSVEWRGEWTTT